MPITPIFRVTDALSYGYQSVSHISYGKLPLSIAEAHGAPHLLQTDKSLNLSELSRQGLPFNHPGFAVTIATINRFEIKTLPLSLEALAERIDPIGIGGKVKDARQAAHVFITPWVSDPITRSARAPHIDVFLAADELREFRSGSMKEFAGFLCDSISQIPLPDGSSGTNKSVSSTKHFFAAIDRVMEGFNRSAWLGIETDNFNGLNSLYFSPEHYDRARNRWMLSFKKFSEFFQKD